MNYQAGTPIGIPTLMRKAFSGSSLKPQAAELLVRFEEDPNDANALIDLSTIFQIHGHPEVAMEFQAKALALRQHYRLQESSSGNPLRLLAIMGPGIIMANMPIEFLIESIPVQLEVLYLAQGLPAPKLIPDHDVAIVCVCESDENQNLLEGLEEIVDHWPKPILNHPRRIRSLSRERFGGEIEGTEGVQVSRSVRFTRKHLDSSIATNLWKSRKRMEPDGWIIRPVDSHAGHGLERFSNSKELRRYLENDLHEEFYVATFVNYRSPDGLFRKYRIAMVDQQCFPVHMAISPNWMVHYLNADMLENQKNRDEEAAFMESFDAEFGLRQRDALTRLTRRIGLEYVVYDCAEAPNGDLLVFEADNGAVVHSMDPPDLFPYKAKAMQYVFAAFHQMLMDASANRLTSASVGKAARRAG